jgi:hypothetical protein
MAVWEVGTIATSICYTVSVDQACIYNWVHTQFMETQCSDQLSLGVPL